MAKKPKDEPVIAEEELEPDDTTVELYPLASGPWSYRVRNAAGDITYVAKSYDDRNSAERAARRGRSDLALVELPTQPDPA